MVIRHEDLIGTYEQKRALVDQFNLMDDTFFAVIMEHKDACEYLLSALLGKTVRVIKNKTQYSLRNIDNRSIVLDALVEDEEHRLYDVEVQISDGKNLGRRMRYYHTAIDWSYLEKGEDYNKLPELYMIFITAFDPFGRNKNHYEVRQYIDSETEYGDGIHRLYFNTAVDDGTGLSKLLQYLKQSEASNNNFGALSQAVNFHKVRNEGVEHMCKAVEDYAKGQRLEGLREGKLEMVADLIKDGMPLEKALKYARIDEETYKEFIHRKQ